MTTPRPDIDVKTKLLNKLPEGQVRKNAESLFGNDSLNSFPSLVEDKNFLDLLNFVASDEIFPAFKACNINLYGFLLYSLKLEDTLGKRRPEYPNYNEAKAALSHILSADIEQSKKNVSYLSSNYYSRIDPNKFGLLMLPNFQEALNKKLIPLSLLEDVFHPSDLRALKYVFNNKNILKALTEGLIKFDENSIDILKSLGSLSRVLELLSDNGIEKLKNNEISLQTAMEYTPNGLTFFLSPEFKESGATVEEVQAMGDDIDPKDFFNENYKNLRQEGLLEISDITFIQNYEPEYHNPEEDEPEEKTLEENPIEPKKESRISLFLTYEITKFIADKLFKIKDMGDWSDKQIKALQSNLKKSFVPFYNILLAKTLNIQDMKEWSREKIALMTTPRGLLYLKHKWLTSNDVKLYSIKNLELALTDNNMVALSTGMIKPASKSEMKMKMTNTETDKIFGTFLEQYNSINKLVEDYPLRASPKAVPLAREEKVNQQTIDNQKMGLDNSITENIKKMISDNLVNKTDPKGLKKTAAETTAALAETELHKIKILNTLQTNVYLTRDPSDLSQIQRQLKILNDVFKLILMEREKYPLYNNPDLIKPFKNLYIKLLNEYEPYVQDKDALKTFKSIIDSNSLIPLDYDTVKKEKNWNNPNKLITDLFRQKTLLTSGLTTSEEKVADILSKINKRLGIKETAEVKSYTTYTKGGNKE